MVQGRRSCRASSASPSCGLRMGSTSGSGRLDYMSIHEADALRAQLLALAHRGEGKDGAPAGPRRQQRGAGACRRAAATIDRLGGAQRGRGSRRRRSGPAVVVALIFWPDRSRQAVIGGERGRASSGVLTAVWRRINGEYNLTVAEASDGLRLRAGLLETTAETIRPGRVQAVRMLEPILWRPFGWCRLEADIAGRQKKKGENRAQSRQLRAVLPVGSHEEAARLLARLIADPPTERLPAPPAARFKSPFRYHNLSWGHNDTCVVTTSGRTTRITAWTPVSKLQSVRRVQGQIAAAASVSPAIRLDTAGAECPRSHSRPRSDG